MSAARRASRVARALAALIGAPLAAFSIGAALIAFLPVSPELAYAIGAHSIIPLWVALSCLVPLARTGRGAWLFCLGTALPLLAALSLRSGS